MRWRSRASSKLAKAQSRKAKTLKAVRHSSSSASGQRTEWLTRELHEAQDHPFSNFALHASSEPFEARRRADKLPCAPIKRCLKFMAPAVKKIEFLLIGHLFPVCMVFPVLSTSSPPLSHGEISRVCEIPAEILTFPALVENAPQSARSLEQSDVGPVC
jgi:hypothetical protein